MTKGSVTSTPVTVSLIAAMAENRVIGIDNTLPWSIPEDMKWFREQTRNKAVIMGRKTYESIGRLLPKRPNIIITRNKDYTIDAKGVHSIVSDVAEALIRAHEYAATDDYLEEIMIIGGGEIYQLFLPIANKIYLTTVHKEVEGDTLFPELNLSEWDEMFAEVHNGDPAFTFKIYEKTV